MNEKELTGVMTRIAAAVGNRPLAESCTWMLTEPVEGSHCLLISPPVPSTAPHIPELDEARKSFASFVRQYTRERYNGDAPAVYKSAGIPRQIYHRITTDAAYGVSKRTAIRLAVVFGLTPDEADTFLKAAGYAFSDAIAEDVVLRACLGATPPIRSFFDIDKVLSEFGIDYSYAAGITASQSNGGRNMI